MPGLYIHFPFCRSKCVYCDFYSETDLASVPEWISAVRTEARLRSGFFTKDVNTVYLGGGTPSLLRPGRIRELLLDLKRIFTFSSDAEITLETNPGTVSPNTLKAYLDAGINRLSIGIQSLNDEELRSLGRIHTSREAIGMAEAATDAGFNSVSGDLIFGFPDQRPSQWRRTLDRAIELNLNHLSVYAMTWHGGTPLGRKILSGDLPEPEDDTVSRMYSAAHDRLIRAGYTHYEVSSYAKPGHESRHNSAYWTGEPYLGLGPSAHSFDGRRRFWNRSNLTSYLDCLRRNELAEGESEMLTDEKRRLEKIALGLRTNGGIDAVWIQGRDKMIESLIKAGFLVEKDGRLLPTAQGMWRADGMAAELV